MIQKEVLDQVQYIHPFSTPSFIFSVEESPLKVSPLLKEVKVWSSNTKITHLYLHIEHDFRMESENKLYNLPKVGIGCVNEKY